MIRDWLRRRADGLKKKVEDAQDTAVWGLVVFLGSAVLAVIVVGFESFRAAAWRDASLVALGFLATGGALAWIRADMLRRIEVFRAELNHSKSSVDHTQKIQREAEYRHQVLSEDVQNLTARVWYGEGGPTKLIKSYEKLRSEVESLDMPIRDEIRDHFGDERDRDVAHQLRYLQHRAATNLRSDQARHFGMYGGGLDKKAILETIDQELKVLRAFEHSEDRPAG